MKIILREDIERLGSAGDVVTVKDGYARNYLIPRKLVYLATEANLHVWESEKRKRLARAAKETQEAEVLKAALAEVSLVVPMQVGEEGRLFGSVTNRVVGDALKEKGFDIDHRHIVIEEPIRVQGVHDVTIRLAHGVVATVRVEVVPTNQPEAPAPQEEAAAEGESHVAAEGEAPEGETQA